MKKRIFLAIFLCLALAGVISPQSWVYSEGCIATAWATITTGDNANMTDDFGTTDQEVPVDADMATLTVWFTHAGAGDG